MSKRVEILEIRLDQLESEANKLDTRTHRLYMRKQNEQKLMLGSYFHVSGDKLECVASSGERVKLTFKDDNYASLVEYNLDQSWSRDENGERAVSSKIYHNGTTINDLDEYAVEQAQARLEFIQCAVDHNDDMIAAWNTIEKKYDKLIDSFRSKKSELRQAINDQYRDINKLEEEALELKLTKGIKFTRSESGRLPSIDVRWDWEINRLLNLKVLRTSASGKSADIELVQKSQRWDKETESYVETEVNNTFKSVRMDKIRGLVKSAQRNSQIV